MTSGRASELLQQPQVVLPEGADVGQAVPQQPNSLQPPAECEARDLLRVVPDELEDVRVDRPGPADLDPARVLADPAAAAVAEKAGHIRLDRRLREREVVGREARLPLLAE